MTLCEKCDCADPTALPGLAAECDCECHKAERRKRVFTFYTDPGHGWLAVPRVLVDELGIAQEVTAYSYQSRDGKTVYLEEDCDASLFYEAYEAQRGPMATPEHVNRAHRDSFVRSLPEYRPSMGKGVA